MSETKGLVKCVLGFLLSILVIVGGAFGLDVNVDVTDTQTPTSEVGEPPTEENVEITDEVFETQESPADSTPTEEENSCVDESVEADVTTTTDETETNVT